MREIRKVLTTVNYGPEEMQMLRAIFPESAFVQKDIRDSKGILQELPDTDVAILLGDVDLRFLGDNGVKWIHCDHAGLNRSARAELFDRGILLTGSSGRSSPVLAEHCIYFMLNACYHTRQLLEAQTNHIWGVPGMDTWRGLYGRTAGIVGFGNNGRELAVRLHAMGMNLITYSRSDLPDGFPYIAKHLNSTKGDTLEPLLRESDFIILCISLTDETKGLLRYDTLRQAKTGAILINMARGEIAPEADLIRALDEGILSCCGLDVFETEPLPKDSPLWDRKDVLITPHTTPQVPNRAKRCLDIIRENARRYRAEEPLLNQLTRRDVFHDEKQAKLEQTYLQENQKPKLEEA